MKIKIRGRGILEVKCRVDVIEIMLNSVKCCRVRLGFLSRVFGMVKLDGNELRIEFEMRW